MTPEESEEEFIQWLTSQISEIVLDEEKRKKLIENYFKYSTRIKGNIPMQNVTGPKDNYKNIGYFYDSDVWYGIVQGEYLDQNDFETSKKGYFIVSYTDNNGNLRMNPLFALIYEKGRDGFLFPANNLEQNLFVFRNFYDENDYSEIYNSNETIRQRQTEESNEMLIDVTISLGGVEQSKQMGQLNLNGLTLNDTSFFQTVYDVFKPIDNARYMSTTIKPKKPLHVLSGKSQLKDIDITASQNSDLSNQLDEADNYMGTIGKRATAIGDEIDKIKGIIDFLNEKIKNKQNLSDTGSMALVQRMEDLLGKAKELLTQFNSKSDNSLTNMLEKMNFFGSDSSEVKPPQNPFASAQFARSSASGPTFENAKAPFLSKTLKKIKGPLNKGEKYYVGETPNKSKLGTYMGKEYAPFGSRGHGEYTHDFKIGDNGNMSVFNDEEDKIHFFQHQQDKSETKPPLSARYTGTQMDWSNSSSLGKRKNEDPVSMDIDKNNDNNENIHIIKSSKNMGGSKSRKRHQNKTKKRRGQKKSKKQQRK